jgi:hypothetical protein
LKYFIGSDSASMLEGSDSRTYVKLIVLAHLTMAWERQGFEVGNQVTDIIVLSKENTIRV